MAFRKGYSFSVHISSGSVIDLGYVINKNVPPNSIVVGVPGKVTKVMAEEEKNVNVRELFGKRRIA